MILAWGLWWWRTWLQDRHRRSVARHAAIRHAAVVAGALFRGDTSVYTMITSSTKVR